MNTRASDAASRRVPCPRCGAPSLFAPANRWRPFCSERCRTIDFGAWANEAYRVEAPPSPDPDAPAPDAEPRH